MPNSMFVTGRQSPQRSPMRRSMTLQSGGSTVPDVENPMPLVTGDQPPMRPPMQPQMQRPQLPPGIATPMPLVTQPQGSNGLPPQTGGPGPMWRPPGTQAQNPMPNLPPGIAPPMPLVTGPQTGGAAGGNPQQMPPARPTGSSFDLLNQMTLEDNGRVGFEPTPFGVGRQSRDYQPLPIGLAFEDIMRNMPNLPPDVAARLRAISEHNQQVPQSSDTSPLLAALLGQG